MKLNEARRLTNLGPSLLLIAVIGCTASSACADVAEEIKEGVAHVSRLSDRVERDPTDAESVARLLAIAEDRSAQGIVRTNAVAELGILGNTHAQRLSADVVPVLIRLLADDDAFIRREAAQGLGFYGQYAKAAVPVLANALRAERGSDVSRFAAWSLGEIGEQPEIAVPALTEVAWAGSDENEAIDAIRKFGVEAAEATPVLVTALGDSDPRYATNAARALAAVDPGNRALSPAIVRLYHQQSGAARYFVLAAVRELGDRPWPPELAKIVESASTEDHVDTRNLAEQLLETRNRGE